MRPDAQGERADRRHRHLPPGGAAVHRQADRAGHEFRRSGRHRHREHAPAQRAARIAAAADRHRRRAQGHQPLDLRPAERCSTRWSNRRRGCARRTVRHHLPARGRVFRHRCACYGYSPRVRRSTCEQHPIPPGRGSIVGRVALEGKIVHIPDVLADPEYTLSADARRSAAIAPCSAFRCCAKECRSASSRSTRQEVRPFTDKQIELVDHLRRPGGDRDRERAAVRRGAGAHARSDRGAGAADRDLGGAAGSSPVRPASWSRCSRPCWRTRRASARPSSATLYFCEGDAFRAVAHAWRAAGLFEALRREPVLRPAPGTRLLAASSQRSRPSTSPMSRADQAYVERDPMRVVAPSSSAALAPCSRADAQGRRADRRHRHLPPGGPPVHRQADRAGHELRRPGRHRHREHPPAQRAARIAAAADRHRRRAQGHQPLDLRSAGGAADAGRIGGAAVRADKAADHPAEGRRVLSRRGLRLLARIHRMRQRHAGRAGTRDDDRASLARRQGRSHPRCAGRPGLHIGRGAEAGRVSHHARRADAARGHPDRRSCA